MVWCGGGVVCCVCRVCFACVVREEKHSMFVRSYIAENLIKNRLLTCAGSKNALRTQHQAMWSFRGLALHSISISHTPGRFCRK